MKKFLVASLAVTVTLSTWIATAGLYRKSVDPSPIAHVTRVPFDSKSIDSQIRANEAALRLDPNAALNWSILSGSYLSRSRESDDVNAALRAEAAARHSLAIRKLGNIGAENKLINSLLQQHRFKDALGECLSADDRHMVDNGTRILRAECLIEVGRYDKAGVFISQNPRTFADISGKAVIAHLLDLNGDSQRALNLLQSCAFEADQNFDAGSDVLAWFHTRLGLQLDRMGRHAEAIEQFKISISLYPRDYKALAALAKVSAQDGRWQEAIEWGKKSDEIAQMADVRALVGDAYAMLGDTQNAEKQYALVADLVGRPSGQNDGLHEVTSAAGTHGHRLDRQYALFCADHNRDPVGAYAAAIRDFAAREDIYAYDTLAWVCYAQGNNDEALKAIEIALSRNTRDALMNYHAGMIYLKAGNHAKANQYLRRALAIDPKFDGIEAPRSEELIAQSTNKGIQQ